MSISGRQRCGICVLSAEAIVPYVGGKEWARAVRYSNCCSIGAKHCACADALREWFGPGILSPKSITPWIRRHGSRIVRYRNMCSARTKIHSVAISTRQRCRISILCTKAIVPRVGGDAWT